VAVLALCRGGSGRNVGSTWPSASGWWRVDQVGW
jgi:hypothetical protein